MIGTLGSRFFLCLESPVKPLVLLGVLVVPPARLRRARHQPVRPVLPFAGFRRANDLAWILDVGGYCDSGRNTALLAGAGGLFKVSDGWRLGAALAVLDSATYNRGKTTLAPVPLAAYETRRVTFNFVYLPRVSDINEVATLGFWATWWVR